jgi:hypothetical protein
MLEITIEAATLLPVEEVNIELLKECIANGAYFIKIILETGATGGKIDFTCIVD